MTQSASEIAGVALIWRAGVGTSSSWFGFQFLAESRQFCEHFE